MSRDRATGLIERGLALWGEGDAEAAVAAWQEALAHDPGDGRARTFLAAAGRSPAPDAGESVEIFDGDEAPPQSPAPAGESWADLLPADAGAAPGDGAWVPLPPTAPGADPAPPAGPLLQAGFSWTQVELSSLPVPPPPAEEVTVETGDEEAEPFRPLDPPPGPGFAVDEGLPVIEGVALGPARDPEGEGEPFALEEALPPGDPRAAFAAAGSFHFEGDGRERPDPELTPGPWSAGEPERPAATPGAFAFEDGPGGFSFELPAEEDRTPPRSHGPAPFAFEAEVDAGAGTTAGGDDVLALVEAPPPAPPTVPAAAPRPAADARSEADRLVAGARDLFALGDFSGSLELVHKALELEPAHAEARGYLERNEETLVQMYESKLGPLVRHPRVLLQPDELVWLNLDHRAGFVLAQIDGRVSFDDIFALSGMTRLDTAKILVELLEQGAIAA